MHPFFLFPRKMQLRKLFQQEAKLFASVLFSHEAGENILAARSFEEFIFDLKDLD